MHCTVHCTEVMRSYTPIPILCPPCPVLSYPIPSGDLVQGSQMRLKKLSGDLSCLSRIMALVATLKCGLSDPERALLESYLCPDLQGGGGAGGGSDQGCEEAMDASLTYLLKTSLAKNAKENAIIHSSALEVWRDIPKHSCCAALCCCDCNSFATDCTKTPCPAISCSVLAPDAL